MASPTLTTLPYDIKVQILKELLCSERPIVFGTVRSNGPGSTLVRTGSRLHPAILRTCRALYDDGADILHHFNTFEIADDRSSDFEVFMLWARSMQDRNLAALKSFTLPLDFHCPWPRKASTMTPEELVQNDLTRAQEIRDYVRIVSVFSTPVQHPRHICVQLTTPIYQPQDAAAMMKQIAVLRALAAVKSLDSLVLTGYMTRIWGRYLSRKLQMPIHYVNVKMMSWSIKEVMFNLMEEMEGTEDLLAQDSELSEMVSRCRQEFDGYDWNETSRAFVHRQIGGQVYAVSLKDGNHHVQQRYRKYPSSGDSAQESAIFGVQIFEDEKAMLQKTFDTELGRDLEELKIKARKMAFLTRFWNELKSLHVLHRKDKEL